MKRTLRFGVSMPAVTTRLVRTNADILNGKNTGCPLSGILHAIVSL